jgi:non-reducing end alpha-L-arabinofuranosidase
MTTDRFCRLIFRPVRALCAIAMLAAGCSSTHGSTGATGGNNGSGGAGGNGGGAAGVCSNVAPCGGSVIGSWTVASSCLTVSGELDPTGFFGAGCPLLPVTGSLQVSGTWTANANGTYSDETTTSGTEQIMLAPGCLEYSGTALTCDQVGGLMQAMGYSAVTCTSVAGGGCSCAATVEQHGGLGWVSAASQTAGNFATATGTITLDAANPYGYCVAGSKMTWTPKTPHPTTSGSVVLQMGSSTGSGGTIGSGGGSGRGGAAGGGGATATGGSGGTATGGAGGTAGSGGATGGRGGGGVTGAAGTTGSGGSGGAGTALQGPCDIYAASGTPCVGAYSTTRLMSSKYGGALYQIRIGGSYMGTGGTLKDIGPIAGGAFADGAAQDTLCGSSACTISKLYDQSGKGNDLAVAGAGCYVTTPDTEASAKGRSLTLNGHKVYALYMVSNSNFGSSTGPEHDGYRNNNATGMPMGTDAQAEYELVDGKRANAGCCWDFGSAQRDSCSTGGTGTMDTISFGAKFIWGTGAGSGPWFMMDAEGGVWTGGSGDSATQNPNDPSVTWDYAFGLVKTSTMGGTPQYALRVGNGQSGALTTAYDGTAPKPWNLQGAIVLGIGGDNSNTSYGTFFEGAITAGRPSDATDLAVLQNVQAAGYGK